MSKKTTEPFKVICKLTDGRINSASGFLYLDAILYHAWFSKNAAEVLDGTQKSERAEYMFFGLPLTRLRDQRYAASCGFYRHYDQSVEYWNKRPDFTGGRNERYLDAKGKINISAGPLKAYHFPQVIRTVSDIEFYGVGTIEKIRELLAYIPAVGKKPAAGWGNVKEWIVEPFGEDWSTEGRYGLMRPMPIDEYEPDREYRIMDNALNPPYWKNEKKLCYMPEVVIREN